MSAGADHLSPPGSADAEAARERAVEHGETDARLRQFSPPASTILTVLAAGISCFHIYANLIGIGSDQWLISLHFAGLALLCALRYPASRRQWTGSTLLERCERTTLTCPLSS